MCRAGLYHAVPVYMRRLPNVPCRSVPCCPSVYEETIPNVPCRSVPCCPSVYEETTQCAVQVCTMLSQCI